MKCYQIENWKNGCHFANHIFLIENFCILIKIQPKYFPMGTIVNKSALVQVMAWHWAGDKPLHEAMTTQFTDAYMRHSAPMS